jgi:predicted amino acid dehydrogenase
LHALELTTSETMELLRTTKDTEVIRDITESFLNNADMVKFAKFSPLGSVNEEMMKQAVEIVEKTIPKPEPEQKPEVENV